MLQNILQNKDTIIGAIIIGLIGVFIGNNLHGKDDDKEVETKVEEREGEGETKIEEEPKSEEGPKIEEELKVEEPKIEEELKVEEPKLEEGEEEKIEDSFGKGVEEELKLEGEPKLEGKEGKIEDLLGKEKEENFENKPPFENNMNIPNSINDIPNSINDIGINDMNIANDNNQNKTKPFDLEETGGKNRSKRNRKHRKSRKSKKHRRN